MYRLIEQKHPILSKILKYADMNQYDTLYQSVSLFPLALIGIFIGIIQSLLWLGLDYLGWPKESLAIFTIAFASACNTHQ